MDNDLKILDAFQWNERYLLASVVAEIGFNCFDHNLGHWASDPGLYFGYSLADRSILFTGNFRNSIYKKTFWEVSGKPRQWTQVC